MAPGVEEVPYETDSRPLINISHLQGPGHPGSILGNFKYNPAIIRSQGQTGYLTYGDIDKNSAKKHQVTWAMRQTVGLSPLHDAFGGAGASNPGTNPAMNDFYHSSG